MTLIKEAFYLIDAVIKKYNIPYETADKYYSTYLFVKDNVLVNKIDLVDEIARDKIEDFLMKLNIPCLKQNIYKILNPEKEITEEIIENEIQKCTLSDLNDNQLLEYLFYVLFTITYNQKDNLVLMKYNTIIWNTGFHELAKLCRGKVVDINNDYEIVSYPFDKFFNLNENQDTSEEKISDYINNAKYIYVNDKIDGSTITVSKYKGKPLITTNGSFDNIQIDWAIEMFEKQYKTFLNAIEDGYTYIFELVHPENRIVIDYGNEKKLYLLNIRNISTGKLLPLETVWTFAEKHNFPVPEVYNFINLKDMIKLAHNLKGENKEGWVFRIGCNNNEYMVKLKLDEYFAMHRAFDRVTIKWVYKQMLNETIDDTLSICNDKQKEEIFKEMDKINSCRKEIMEHIEREGEKILNKYDLTTETFAQDKELMLKVINEILSSDDLFKHLVLKYVKGSKYISFDINKIKYKYFMQYYKTRKENI